MAVIKDRKHFEQYIGSNPKFDQLEFTLAENAVLWDENRNSIQCTCKEGWKVKALSQKLVKVGKPAANGSLFEVIKGNGQKQKGYLRLDAVMKPASGDGSGKDRLEAEKVAMARLDKILKDKFKTQGPVSICTPFGTYDNCCGVNEIKGTPKADFAIHNHKGENMIFISHKKQGGAKAFQQYGGLTKKAGTQISEHKETIDFLRQTAQYIQDDALQVPTYKDVNDPKLVAMAIFGPQAGGQKFGVNNCQVIGQGEAKLLPKRKEMNCYDLEYDHTVWQKSTDIKKHFMSGQEYRAVFAATYRLGRGFWVDDEQFSGARVGIYPKSLVTGRTNATELP
tara:strand:- start:4966 stop:5976 length:1011 start_codon:yes stop_codon:yes gene_type:complete